MKRGIFVITLLLTLSLSLGSAFFNIDKLTGRASSDTQDVSISVQGNAAPAVEYVSGPASVDPIEAGTQGISFEIHVSDLDGVNNINDASIAMQATFGATVRIGSCIHSNDIDSRVANFSCQLSMNYYDSAGIWSINASALDSQDNYGENNSATFTYSELKSFQTPLSPSQLSWPTLTPGAINVLSSNDPTLVNNTGNYNGNIFITGYDLRGESDSLEMIPASVFSVSESSGSECTGTSLSNASSVNTGISANSGGTPSNIYYCITSVPIVSSQTYSTTATGSSWVIQYA